MNILILQLGTVFTNKTQARISFEIQKHEVTKPISCARVHQCVTPSVVTPSVVTPSVVTPSVVTLGHAHKF